MFSPILIPGMAVVAAARRLHNVATKDSVRVIQSVRPPALKIPEQSPASSHLGLGDNNTLDKSSFVFYKNNDANTTQFKIYYLTGFLHIPLWSLGGYVYYNYNTTHPNDRKKIGKQDTVATEKDLLPAARTIPTITTIVASLGIASVGVALFLKIHSFAGRYVTSIRLSISQGLIEVTCASSIFGFFGIGKPMTFPTTACFTTKKAVTGVGEGLTGIPIPKPGTHAARWYGQPIHFWREGLIPLRAPGHKFLIDRDGRFIKPTTWDDMLFRNT
jgi:hypothetical protein